MPPLIRCLRHDRYCYPSVLSGSFLASTIKSDTSIITYLCLCAPWRRTPPAGAARLAPIGTSAPRSVPTSVVPFVVLPNHQFHNRANSRGSVDLLSYSCPTSHTSCQRRQVYPRNAPETLLASATAKNTSHCNNPCTVGTKTTSHDAVFSKY